jgi:methylated-DNA-[protein]-cysteine S-methyltransferase
MTLKRAKLKTPIGVLTLFARGGALVAVAFEDYETETRRALARRFGDVGLEADEDPAGAASALEAYFKGDLAALDRVEVDTGGTQFQESVWAALRRIPVGKTISYTALAGKVGRPEAKRAVGAANGANPIPVIIPCHRVIAADGTLGGYGGGLDRKRWLLGHEKAWRAPKGAKRASRGPELPFG